MTTSLILCSPNTFSYSNDYLVLDVDKEMLELVKLGPRLYTADKDTTEDNDGDRVDFAYCFGDLFDFDEYSHPGYLLTSSSQVGFVEEKASKKKHYDIKTVIQTQQVDRGKGMPRRNAPKSRKHRANAPPDVRKHAAAGGIYPTREYQKIHGPLPENDDAKYQEYMEKLRKNFSEIIWVGVNLNKDNVHLHYHVDPKLNRVDSILLDCGWAYSVKYHDDKIPPSVSTGEDTDYSEISEVHSEMTENTEEKPKK